MKDSAKGVSLMSIIFVILFIVAVIYPVPIKKIVKVGTGGVMPAPVFDFGEGRDEFVTNRDLELGPGEFEFDLVMISNKITPLRSANSGSVSIKARKRITISKSGSINYSGTGNSSEIVKNDNNLGSGGSHGGLGGAGRCLLSNAEKKYDLSLFTFKPSFGGAGLRGSDVKGQPGLGGGSIILESPEIYIDGSVVVDGLDGIEGAGGGAGGKIILLSDKLLVNGKLSARGGNGGSSFMQGAGGGGGGIVYSAQKIKTEYIDVAGGLGGKSQDIYTGCDGQNGASGVILYGW